MYIKIKNPAHYELLTQLTTLVVVFVVILMVLITFTLVVGSITAVWEGTVKFFYYIKQEKGLLTAGFCIVGILMIPVGIISGLIEWWKKRTRWITPTTVYALDFGPDGVTAYTRSNTQFLLYKETDFEIAAELLTVRTKNGSHASLRALTLTFLSQGNLIEISHRLTTDKLLYQLADLHAHFKTFAFNCTPSSGDQDQQELAAFLKEQIQNQICYGLHCCYHRHFIMILCGLLFIALGIGALCLMISVSGHFNPSKDLVMWVLLLQGVGFLTGGIILLYSVIKDKCTAYKLKQLRGE